MLAIQMRSTPLGKIRWRQWYIGEPTPTDIGRVVTFQADGDELNLFLDAMAASNGFVVKKPEPLKKKQYRIMYEPNFENDFGPPTSTGIVRRTRPSAARWIAANPARGGRWSIKEEVFDGQSEPTVVYGELARPEND